MTHILHDDLVGTMLLLINQSIMNTYTYIHIHTALKGQALSSRSAGAGVGRCNNSPGVHHCGGDPGKSNSHPSPQQRIPDECGRGRMMHVTVNVALITVLLMHFMLCSLSLHLFLLPGAGNCHSLLHIHLQLHSQEHFPGCPVWLQDGVAGCCSCFCLCNSQGEGQGP